MFISPSTLHVPSKHIHDFASEFLKSQDLNYFSIIRCFEDGSIIPLSTQPDFLVDWFQRNPIISMLPKDLVHYQMYTYFWEEALPHSSLSLACERHSLYHGITLMYRYKGYYDMASFAMPEERSFANSYYLSSLLLLQQFYEAFLGKYKRLIKSLDSCKIHLPFEKQDENLTKLVLNNQKGRYEISGYNGNTYLTSIEIMCINLLNSGNSYKTIAGILDISVRTVETYLTRAKLRAGYINMTDLIKSLNSVNTFM